MGNAKGIELLVVGCQSTWHMCLRFALIHEKSYLDWLTCLDCKVHVYMREGWASWNHTNIRAFETHPLRMGSLNDWPGGELRLDFVFFFTECSKVRCQSSHTCLKCAPLYLPLYFLSCFFSYVHITSQSNQVRHLRCVLSWGKAADVCFGQKKKIVD